MTPGARIAAAIEIIDQIVDGAPAEAALTRWARSRRFAGSGDRAAIRDHVFDCLRHWRSDAVRGGGDTGRARLIGRLRAQGIDPQTLFDGQGYAPPALSPEEMAAGAEPETTGDRWNLPDWLIDTFSASLGDTAEATALALQERAPVTIRVNTARASVADAAKSLEVEGITSRPNPLSGGALTLVDGVRRLRNAQAYRDGWVELQDASSQAVVDGLPAAQRVLDYCAGGGGKSLAMAAQGRDVTASDADPQRMQDLPARAERAGTPIEVVASDALSQSAPFDLVLCDAPCSGSGAWRRAPEGKLRLTQARLDELCGLQLDILTHALHLVAPDGVLVYATCSLFRAENEGTIDAFVAQHPDWKVLRQQRFGVTADGDGFFAIHLTRVV